MKLFLTCFVCEGKSVRFEMRRVIGFTLADSSSLASNDSSMFVRWRNTAVKLHARKVSLGTRWRSPIES